MCSIYLSTSLFIYLPDYFFFFILVASWLSFSFGAFLLVFSANFMGSFPAPFPIMRTFSFLPLNCDCKTGEILHETSRHQVKDDRHQTVKINNSVNSYLIKFKSILSLRFVWLLHTVTSWCVWLGQAWAEFNEDNFNVPLRWAGMRPILMFR